MKSPRSSAVSAFGTVWWRGRPEGRSIGQAALEFSQAVYETLFGQQTLPTVQVPRDWYIDPVHGDDSNSGTVQGGTIRALRTHDALRRRIGDARIEGDVVVHLLNHFDADNPIMVDFTLGADATLTYKGEKAQVQTLAKGTFAEVVPIDPSSDQALEVRADFDWGRTNWDGLINSSADLPLGELRRIQITGGDRKGAIAYACKAIDKDGVPWARTSPFGTPEAGPPQTRWKHPAAPDPFVVEAGFVRIDSFAVDIKISPIGTPVPPGKVHLSFVDLELVPNTDHNHQVRALAQHVEGGPGTIAFVGCGVGRLTPQYANKVMFDFCRLGGTHQDFQATLVQLGGCCCLSEIAVFEGARVTAFTHTIFQGGSLRVQGLARLGDVGFFDADGAGLLVEQNGTAQVMVIFGPPLFDGGKTVYGTGHGGTGAKVRAGGCIVYDYDPGDSDTPAEDTPRAAGITVSGQAGEVDVAGTIVNWADINPDLEVKRAGVVRNE